MDNPDHILDPTKPAPLAQAAFLATLAAWVRKWRVAVLFTFVAGWYGLATLPYLDNFPHPTQDEAQIAAPGYKLATQGVYGQDLYTGYYHSEQYVYEFMPLHPLLLALCFKLFGMGMWQARLVSTVCG